MSLALVLGWDAAQAGGQSNRTWTVDSGRPTVLAQYFEIRGADCQALRAPTVAVTEQPALGRLVVNRTNALAQSPARCRHVKVPVTRVLYLPGKQPGKDVFAWKVYFQARDLGTRTVRGTATIRPGRPRQ